MSATAKLLKLHRIEQQRSALRQRVDSAERYLRQQETKLAAIAEKRSAVQAQARQMQAANHNQETEIAGIDERVEKLREQMNNSRNAKEYQVFLVEINTLKADKATLEEGLLESMEKIEQCNESLQTIKAQEKERTGIRDNAAVARDERRTDIKERLDELTQERDQAAKDVPAGALSTYNELAARRSGEDGFDDVPCMTHVEEHSRRSMDYACSGCQTMLPVEIINRLLSSGEITHCVSCGAILYVEETLRESVLAAK